jgi:dolichol-phosphate mannosyltransferase
VPIRVASFAGIFVGLMSLMVAFLAFLSKLIWWDAIPIGISPIVIGMFLMFGLVLVFIGVLGEYIGAILTYVQKRPIVVERERVNFKDDEE